MGLFIAKEYIKNENTVENSVPLYYDNKLHMLKKDERFICTKDEFLEFVYTGDEIKITYGNEDRLMVNNVCGTLIFTVIEGNKESKFTTNMIYPLTMIFSSIKILKIKETDYENPGSVNMSRYLEYRD
jgi:hypothetical protein